MPKSVTALLGRRDEPTDAVEEYCRFLGEALCTHKYQLEIRRVPWDKYGWSEALRALRLQAASWSGRWILVQYTALAWSSRGFPQRVLRVLRELRTAQARIAVVFHDVEPFAGSRLVDRFRRIAQLRTMRTLVEWSDAAIFTIPLDKISWLGNPPANAAFIPVGANLPDHLIRDLYQTRSGNHPDRRPDDFRSGVPARSGGEAPPAFPSPVPTIAVFSITGGEAGAREAAVIVAAVRHASQQLGNLRLQVFGRNSTSRESELRSGLAGLPVEISVENILPDEELVRRFQSSDVLLFVRGAISSRRGSAIAGIACGLPVIAFAGSETAPPITDAGIAFFTENNQDELNAALLRVLSDSAWRESLAARSRSAQLAHFSWPSIASSYLSLLNK